MGLPFEIHIKVRELTRVYIMRAKAEEKEESGIKG